MKKKRILFLMNSLGGGGAEKVLSVLIKFFDYEKYEVTVCSIVDTGVYCEEVKKYATHYSPIVSYNGNYISRLWNRVKYKLVYSILPLPCVYKFFVPKGNDVEIAFCEGYVTKLLSHSGSHSKRIAWVHIDLKHFPWTIETGIYKDAEEEKQTYSSFNKIVCVSKTVEKSFKEKYGLSDRTLTIYNPIDIEDVRIKAGKRERRRDGIFRLISIGRLVPQKGYDRLLKIAKLLHDEHLNFNLQILGEGEERETLESYIADNAMESYVSLPGFCSNPYKQLGNSDVFVCSSRAEGFSLVIAEALILGIPVISTYCSGPNELLNEGKDGLLVDNTDDGLYQGLKFALSNMDKIPCPDFNEFANRFSAENKIKQICELF